MSLSIHRKLLLRKLIQWLVSWLPDKAKRMVFVMSLAGMIKGDDQISDQTLRQLNEVMRLGYSDSSLRLPIYLSKVIWEDLSHESKDHLQCNHTVITSDELQIILKDLNTSTRNWQRYGEDQMIKDIRLLVENRALMLSKQ